ncbi:flagellar hook-associated protein FlgK [Aliidiomarina sp. Khilg15.8]
MSFDLLKIGKQATLGHQRSLQITGNNIANVNTPGYVRERPVYTESSTGPGIDRMQVERMIDQFTQRQVRIDTSRASYTDAYLDQARRIDSVLGNDTGAVITAIEDFFDLLQDSNNDPASLTYRELLLTEGKSVNARMTELANFLDNQNEQFNQRIDLEVDEANNLVRNIADINKKIADGKTENRESQGALNTLLNERDEKLRELSEYVDIKTLDFSNGRQAVNLAGGQSLIMEDGTFNLIALRGDPNPNRLEMTTRTESGGKVIDQPVDIASLGGKIGGLIGYRDEVLEPTQFKLGQLAMGFADAINEQSKLGMDLDNELGTNFFDLSNTEVPALPHSSNSAPGQEINVRLEAGKAAELTAHRYEVRMESDTEFRLVALDTNGRAIGNVNDYPLETVPTDATEWVGDLGYGMEFNFAGGPFAEGDRFEVNFTQNAAANINMNLTRPEDIAMAAPVRVAEGTSNSGGAVMSFDGMDSVDNFFDGNALTDDAPVQARYDGFVNGEHTLSIINNDGDVVGYYSGTDMNNIFANSVQATVDAGGNTVPDPGNTPLYANTPDYDISVNGNPDAGDTFNVEYNTNGYADNTNSLEMTDLQREKTLRRNPVVDNEKNMMTYNEGYGRLVSDVGNKVAEARTANEASSALLEQSKGFYDSVSGVNLDEEASNLLQYEQAYNAAARIITVSQTVFDTLLNSTR